MGVLRASLHSREAQVRAAKPNLDDQSRGASPRMDRWIAAVAARRRFWTGIQHPSMAPMSAPQASRGRQIKRYRIDLRVGLESPPHCVFGFRMKGFSISTINCDCCGAASVRAGSRSVLWAHYVALHTILRITTQLGHKRLA
jgi:hypothetical protein